MSNSQIQKLVSQENLRRSFTHLTIPAEIWLRGDLSIQAKCLWAEIRSLHDKEVGGCYASEEYLCAFMQLKRRRLFDLFKELKNKGLLKVVSFDGRKTVRCAMVPPVEYEEKNKPEKKPDPPPDSGCPENRTPQKSVHSRCAENCTPSVQKTALETANPPAPPNKEYIENKVESKKARMCAPVRPANMDVSSSLKFGKNVSLEKEDYEKLCALHGKAVIAEFIEKIDDFCSSTGKKYKDYAATIRNWIRREKDKTKFVRKYEDPKADIRKRQWDDYEKHNGPFENIHVFE